MLTEQQKCHILTFLPVMKELEALGVSPIQAMFGQDRLTMDVIEKCYVAIRRAEEKYPKWAAVVRPEITKLIKKAG